MANEFVARLGLIALDNSTVSGSLTVTNGITGSLFGTASWSTNALTSSFVPGYISGSGTTNYVSKFTAGGVIGPSQIFDNGSSVGIGTTSPGARLHIKQTASEIPLILDNSNGTSGSFTQYRVNASSGWEVGMAGSGDSYKWFFSYGTFSSANSKFTITNSGDIGVGTIAPLYKLHVVGGHVKLPNNYKLYFGDVAENLGFSIGSVGASNNMAITNNNNATLQIGTAGTGGHIIFTPNSSELVRFTGDGNVGIGTTSPAAKLDVYTLGATASNNALLLRAGNNADASGSNQILFGYNGTADYAHAIKTRHQSANAIGNGIDFYTWKYGDSLSTTAGQYVMTMAGNGNVGIGTTSPSYKLDVIGTFRAYYDASTYLTVDTSNISIIANGTVTIGNNSTDAVTIGHASAETRPTTIKGSPIYLQTNGDTRIFVSQSGNTGVGTLVPTALLHVSGSTGGVFEVDGAAAINALYVSASGNVGIGTTTPGAILDVYTTGDPTAFFRAAGDFNVNFRGSTLGNTQLFSIRNNNTSVVHLNTQNSARLALGVSAATGSGTVVEHVTINSSGNVGVGTTSPNTRLSVIGNVDLRNTAAGLGSNYGVELSTNSNTPRVSLVDNGVYSGEFFTVTSVVGLKNIANAPLTFGTNNIERARFSADGNFGIGTTSPNAALTVLGSSGDTTSNRDIAVFAENSGIFIDDAGTTNSRLGLVKKAGFSPAIAAGSTTILSLGHWSTVNLLGNIRTGSFTADLSIATNGNVGIGTSTPSYKLDVTGTGQFRSSTVNSGSTPAGIFLSGDDKDAIWRSGLKVQHSSDVAITAGSSIGISLDPLASTSSTFYGSAAIKAIRPNATANNQDTDLAIFTRAGASNSTTDTEKMRITAGGNVGIGTTSPLTYAAASTTLEISGKSSGGAGGVYVTNNGKTVVSHFYSDGSVGAVGTQTNQPFIFTSNNTERARITAGGNFLIGLTSDGGQTLQVFGTARVTQDAYFAVTSGNVGIGTTSPAALLHLSSTNPTLRITNTSAGAGAGSIQYYSGSTQIWNLGTHTDNDLYLYNNITAAYNLWIDNATGNLGIGTTSPTAKLQVHGNTLITGSLTVGQSTTGSSEHTLTVGVPPAAGAGEGGQILLAASGGLYTSASMIDNYQNKFRVLRGTNAGSDGYKLQIDMHTGQVQIPNYNSSTAFTGTAVADLAVDSNGNIITVTPGGGGGGSVTINNNTDNYLITATGTANTLNGEANLQFNGSTLTVTGGLTVITGSATELQVTNTGVNIGNALTDAHRISGSISMPHTASGLIRLQDASVWANSANYLYPQIRLPDYQTGITLVNNDEVQFVTNGTAAMAAKLEAGIPNIRFDNATVLKWSTAATNGFNYDVLLRRESAGVLALTGSLKGSSGFTGSLQGTSSWAVSASWAPSAGGSAPTAVTFNRVTTSYTLVLSDAGKTIEMNASAAGTYNITVPPASSVNFADGTFIDVVLYGSGSIQFVTGSGVTFRSANNWTKLGTRYGAATLINIAGDEWYLIGNLNA